MPAFDLKTEDGFRKACQHFVANPPVTATAWRTELTNFLQWVQQANLATRSSLEFQERLWDDNPVSSVGQGQIPVAPVIGQETFRTWVAEASLETLPTDPAERLAQLTGVYEKIVEAFKQAESRIPHLKIFRVLAALFPYDITTIADRGALEKLLRALGRSRGPNPVERHVYVRTRIEEALGPSSGSVEELAFRMQLPWFLYDLQDKDEPEEDRVSKPGQKPGEEILLPLPAARRRRGLTPIAGGFQSVLSILEFVKDGVTRQELMDFLRGIFPNLKDNSLGVNINVLKSELGVTRIVNNEYVLTDRGLRVLESSDASGLADWLLTRVLGIDNLLKALSTGPKSKIEMMALLMGVNPGWTSEYVPAAMIGWLISMAALRREPNGMLALDIMGEDWAARINWEPETLKAEPPAEEASTQGVAEAAELMLPPIPSIAESVAKAGYFPAELLEALHLGLWSQKLRHFAVLAGISGSGKTLLAKSYAKALQGTDLAGEPRVRLEPVQPGWYDPTPLLGYLNPLATESYVRTPVLEFLLRASQDPGHPYVLILDEMNLSRPEQYFAPILSHMETGGAIALHSQGPIFDGVPSSIPYPANLAIIGTVNMDETTHGLSDKVLDRAFTLEFWDINLDNYPHWGKALIPPEQEQVVRALLKDLMESLAPVRLHFGWRVVDDLMSLLQAAKGMGASTPFKDLLDTFVLAKLLPKLRGEDSERFHEALNKTKDALTKQGLSNSSKKVQQLRDDLTRVGSAHFWR